MAFANVPNISRKKINESGKTLRQQGSGIDFDSAVGVASQWRACHAKPINTFQSTLRKKLREYPNDPIVAQRLKRMPTIIDKLRRYPNMQLTTMQDIGGLRAVVDSVSDLYRLADDYRDNSSLKHVLYNETDYVASPRDEDGYRSLHLMYKYRNKKSPEYNDLRIELQIRTKLQHTWATAVETMGTFLGQALKSRQGDKEWLDFFATVSSAFAQVECTAVLPKHAALSAKGIRQEVIDREQALNALDKMRGFYTAVNDITRARPRDGWSYHLIVLNSLKNRVTVTPYSREEFDRAVRDYAKVESEAAKGGEIEPVLVSAGPLATLRRAYPNFFLDITDFCDQVQEIVG